LVVPPEVAEGEGKTPQFADESNEFDLLRMGDSTNQFRLFGCIMLVFLRLGAARLFCS
jgi:hypothetical protein